MDRNVFWSIIENCNSQNGSNFSEKLQQNLKARPVDQIIYFKEFLDIYFKAAVESSSIYIACKAVTGKAAGSDLQSFALWLISQGRRIYFKALENPDALAGLPEIDTGGYDTVLETVIQALETLGKDADETGIYFDTNPEEWGAAVQQLKDTEKKWKEMFDRCEQMSDAAPALSCHYGQKKESEAELIPIYGSNFMTEEIQTLLSELLESPSLQQPRRTGSRRGSAGDPASDSWRVGPYVNGVAKSVSRDKKYGFTDHLGQVMIPLEFDDIDDFYSAIIRVCKDDKWGCIDNWGRTIVPIAYEEISSWGFQEELVAVKKGGLWGAVDESGKIVVPCDYDDVSPCSEGLLSVSKRGKYAVFNKWGKQLTGFLYEQRILYLNGRAVAMRDGKQGLLDEQGKEILPPTFSQVENFYEYNYTMVIEYDSSTLDGAGMKVGFVNRLGEVIIPIIYEKIRTKKEAPQSAEGFLQGRWIALDLHSIKNTKSISKLI